jgi:hypothetical protein
MTLQTLSYLPDAPMEHHDPSIGLAELRKGLYTIVLGYLLCFMVIVGLAGLCVYVFVEAATSASGSVVTGDASVILFGGVLVLGLCILGSLALIVRGKWICLMNAPETMHAKWFMFASILCILTWPALNFGSNLIGEDRNEAKMSKRARTAAVLRREFEDYKKGIPTLDTRGWIRVAGDIASFLSSIFCVLFLRAVALCWGYTGRARFAELYLVLIAVLVAAIVLLIRNPAFYLAQPQFLLGLLGGWVLSGLWYFLLIILTIAGLHTAKVR